MYPWQVTGKEARDLRRLLCDVADSEGTGMVSVGDQEPRFVYFRSNDECRIRCDTARVAQAPSGGAVVDCLGSTSPLGYEYTRPRCGVGE